MRRAGHPYASRGDELTDTLRSGGARSGGRPAAALAAATAALGLWTQPAGSSPSSSSPPPPSAIRETPPADTTHDSARDTLPTFVGTVHSRQTGDPVGGARVMVPGLDRRTTTDADGRFRLESLEGGEYDVRVHYLGYTTNPRRVEFRTRHATRAELWLERTVLAVEDLRVEVSQPRADPMAGFRRRREDGFGLFLDRGDIERRNPAFTSDLFRTLPGVTVTPNRMGQASVTVRRFGGRCRPTVWVDGVLTNALPVDFVTPQSIIGIEVYRGASEVPPQFNKPTTEGCGTIVIWTRKPGHPPPGVESDTAG